MQQIVPHLWFDKEAKEAAAFYASMFKDSKVNSVSTITDTPSGDCDIVSFTLAGQDFMSISAGPVFKFNPSISFFTMFDGEAEIDAVWQKLVEGGEVLMPYQAWPWAKKYGWLQDKYGVSWQIVPTVLGKMMQYKDAQKVERVTKALFQMKKLDIEALKRAFEGTT